MTDLVTAAPDICANDLVISRAMADTLHKRYPGHLWAVTCDGGQGIATVRNLYLSGAWGFVVKLPPIYSASHFTREIVRAGGELLERYRLHRGAFADDEYAQLVTLPTGALAVDR